MISEGIACRVSRGRGLAFKISLCVLCSLVGRGFAGCFLDRHDGRNGLVGRFTRRHASAFRFFSHLIDGFTDCI